MTVLLFTFVACATSSRPTNIAKPEASVRPLGTPFFGSLSEAAPVDLEVTITNRATETLHVRSIRVNSMGMTQYRIESIDQRFHHDIAPGETRALIVPALAVGTTRLQPTEPLLLRLDITFEVKATGKQFREIYSGNRILF